MLLFLFLLFRFIVELTAIVITEKLYVVVSII